MIGPAVDAIPTRIYVVDDDDGVRTSLRALLESYGYEVEEYASGAAFLSHYQPGPRSGCLVLDLHLPAATGIDVMADLRKRTGAYLPILLMTGRGDKTVRDRALAAGASAYLEKPVDSDHLMEAVRNLVELRIANERNTEPA